MLRALFISVFFVFRNVTPKPWHPTGHEFCSSTSKLDVSQNWGCHDFRSSLRICRDSFSFKKLETFEFCSKIFESQTTTHLSAHPTTWFKGQGCKCKVANDIMIAPASYVFLFNRSHHAAEKTMSYNSLFLLLVHSWTLPTVDASLPPEDLSLIGK